MSTEAKNTHRPIQRQGVSKESMATTAFALTAEELSPPHGCGAGAANYLLRLRDVRLVGRLIFALILARELVFLRLRRHQRLLHRDRRGRCGPHRRRELRLEALVLPVFPVVGPACNSRGCGQGRRLRKMIGIHTCSQPL